MALRGQLTSSDSNVRCQCIAQSQTPTQPRTRTHDMIHKILSFHLGMVLSAIRRSPYHRHIRHEDMRCTEYIIWTFSHGHGSINQSNIPIYRGSSRVDYFVFFFGSALRPERSEQKYYRLSRNKLCARCFFISDEEPKNQLHRSLDFTLHTQQTIIFLLLLHFIYRL